MTPALKISHKNWIRSYFSCFRMSAIPRVFMLSVFLYVYNFTVYTVERINSSKEAQMSMEISSSSIWNPANCVVIGLAVGYGLDLYRQFVGSLRATGYPGHIILGISPNAPEDVRTYLDKQNVTVKEVPFAPCTYDNTTTADGGLFTRQVCTEAYQDYKLMWGRFALSGDWLRECKECTDGVMLTDVRDAYFQADPFVAVKYPQPIMLFEEIFPNITTEHWLTDIPLKWCKNYTFGATPMLCAGSTMGTREGILEYIRVMVREIDLWKNENNCRSILGDDQSIHNYLYYTNQLPGAIAIPHRTGPIHVIGWQAARIKEAANKEAEKIVGIEKAAGWVSLHGFNGLRTPRQDWLPPEHNLIDPKTGFITNLDGSPSPQVHQIDRFGPSFHMFWLNDKVNAWNDAIE